MEIAAIICRGYQFASGIRPGCNVIGGGIRAQHKAWLRRGFDLRDYLGGKPYWGTLNCYIGRQRIDPLTYARRGLRQRGALLREARHIDARATRWNVKLRDIAWHPGEKAEHFHLLKGRITYRKQQHPCWIYFPVPKAQPDTAHLPTILEIIARPLPFSPKGCYGEKVTLHFPDHRLRLSRPRRLTP